MTLAAHTFQRGDHFYVVAPVAPFEPADAELGEVAFARELRATAPNGNIGWLRGQYVEADRPNANGQFWASKELEIASLTPVLMPVTVMHDPRTAVGMIADAKLLAADEAAGVPRARIDTTLGVWRHRFPDVWAEVATNYERGELMQSMECWPAYYDCIECGQRFPKLPGNAEVAQWCGHLKAGEVAAGLTTAARRLGNVTFTGTGLIFGSRGAKGALDTAHLEAFQEEVAEFHEKAKRDSSRKTQQKPKTRRGRSMEIEDREYAELIAAKQERDSLKKRVDDLEPVAAKVPDLEREKEAAEIAKVAAETERDAVKAEKTKLEEQARASTLATERTGKLGDKFLAKLPESIKTKLEEQAKSLSDEDWTSRLDELAALTGVKADEKTEGGGGGGGGGGNTFTADELARQAGGGGGGGAGDGVPSVTQSPDTRRSVIGGLAKITAPPKTPEAAK